MTPAADRRRARERVKLLTVPGRARKLVRDARYRAKKRSIPFDLTVEWVTAELHRGHCALSGLPFDLRLDPESRAYSPSIDKMIPELGYVQSNCRLVLNSLNSLRGRMTDAALLCLASALVDHHRRTPCPIHTD